MEERSKRLTPEVLLAHAGWLRELAAGLVADPGAADDVVQDTWVAALRHPPAPDRPLGPWLARVARNFAFRRRRGERRRAERECLAEPAREAPTPAQTVERLELQRSVVEAVLSLEEPFRTTLVQRYFEGHPAAEIARAFGVPAGTVRWRLQRGLALLRERLDGRFGSRASWCALLAPLARRGSSPGTPAPSVATSTVFSTVVAMSAMKAAAVLGILALAGVVWWSATDRRSATASATIAESAAKPADFVEAAPGAEEPATSSRDTRLATLPSAASEPVPTATTAAPAPREAVVEARFVDAAGVPWSGVLLAAREEKRPEVDWGSPVLSKADGRARIELVFPDLRPDDPRFSSRTLLFLASRAGCTTVALRALVRVDETTHLGDVVLAAGIRLAGRVVDEQGRGIANATVGSTAAALPPEEGGRLARHGCDAFDVPVTRSADDGSFVLDGVGAGTWRLWGHASGTRYAWSEPLDVTAERDLLGLELVLPALLATDRIEGRIVDPDGNPFVTELLCRVRGSRFRGYGRSYPVDGQGRFSILIEHDDEVWDLSARDDSGLFATSSVEGVRPGTLDVVLRMAEPRFLDVHVRGTDGQPVEEAVFTASAGFSWSEVKVEPSAPGHYPLPFPEGKFRLQVSARGYRTRWLGPFEPASLPPVLDVTCQRVPAVRGRVLAEGRAVAGAHVELREDVPDALETVNGFRCVMSGTTSIECSMDDDGRFELHCDMDGDFWIRATAPGLAPAELGPLVAGRLDPDSFFEIVLTEGGAIEGRVLTEEGHVAEGTIVAINHGDGAPRTTRAGPGGVFRFEGLASGKWQVLASDVEVDPNTTTYASTGETDPIEWSCEVTAGRTTRYDLDLRPR